MGFLHYFLRFFFKLLYNQFAWTYDLVSGTVSLGKWTTWIETVIPYIQGDRILELGHGPGYLQYALYPKDLDVFGLDQSLQMGQLSAQKLKRSGCAHANLIQGRTQALPFPDQIFSTVAATFPTKYFLHPLTLQEVYRTLQPGGRYVILPVAWHIGQHIPERLAAWLFKITCEGSETVAAVIREQIQQPFEQAGFHIEFTAQEVRNSRVLIVVASKND
ncbi:MAG: class I SAM-dependent methyltransferase [Anaerolineales bacterium]|nr:class I SAM-dependent methyltransferase [Anaerolineales bacterium]